MYSYYCWQARKDLEELNKKLKVTCIYVVINRIIHQDIENLAIPLLQSRVLVVMGSRIIPFGS
jgi:hypothetical protein